MQRQIRIIIYSIVVDFVMTYLISGIVDSVLCSNVLVYLVYSIKQYHCYIVYLKYAI